MRRALRPPKSTSLTKISSATKIKFVSGMSLRQIAADDWVAQACRDLPLVTSSLRMVLNGSELSAGLKLRMDSVFGCHVLL